MKPIDRYIGNLFHSFTWNCKQNGLDLTNLLENENFYKCFKGVVKHELSPLLIKSLEDDNN